MKRNNPTLFLYTFITVFGGLLTGLYIAGISGAVLFIQDHFGLTNNTAGIMLGILATGCLCGAFVGNILSNRGSKKKVWVISVLLFIAGSIGSGLSTNIYGLTLFRLGGSFATGLISTVAPLYIGEISSIRHKEAFANYNQIAMLIGIVIAYIINYLFLNFSVSWRWMLGFPFTFSIPYLVLITFLPEIYSGVHQQNRGIAKTNMLPVLAGIHILLYYTPFLFDNIIYKP